MFSEKNEWKKYYLKNVIKYTKLKLGLNKFVDKQFVDRDIISIENANDIIYELIASGKPFMLARLGETEVRAIADALGIRLGAKRNADKERLKRLYNNAGVFPYGEDMEIRFMEYYCRFLSEADVLGVWNTFMQDYIIDKYVGLNTILTELKSLEPYYNKLPWSRALQGKKVLVIHPFSESIKKQYLKREQLFDNNDILPEFELTTLQAVQTIAGCKDDRFNNWFEALDYMYDEAMKRDFDVAILGCGAYGFPLAARIKKAGKQAIHLGGATQILFGIKGTRWDNHPFISKLYNSNWIRPDESEKPTNSGSVENSCYW